LPVHLPVEGRRTRRAREVLGPGRRARVGRVGVARGLGLARRGLAVPEPGVRGARLNRRRHEGSRPSAALLRYFHASSTTGAALLKTLLGSFAPRKRYVAHAATVTRCAAIGRRPATASPRFAAGSRAA